MSSKDGRDGADGLVKLIKFLEEQRITFAYEQTAMSEARFSRFLEDLLSVLQADTEVNDLEAADPSLEYQRLKSAQSADRSEDKA